MAAFFAPLTAGSSLAPGEHSESAKDCSHAECEAALAKSWFTGGLITSPMSAEGSCSLLPLTRMLLALLRHLARPRALDRFAPRWQVSLIIAVFQDIGAPILRLGGRLVSTASAGASLPCLPDSPTSPPTSFPGGRSCRSKGYHFAGSYAASYT